jgi:2-polyprenyl-6-methoxyphenol hydroxylase-like FAD-dependent oxidoreductase
MAGVADSVLALIAATPAASLVEHGVYIRPADSMSPDSFGKGRVVIMGDAAHPLRPTGQGFNQTVEDAYALGAALARSCSSGGDIDLARLQVSCELIWAWFCAAGCRSTAVWC